MLESTILPVGPVAVTTLAWRRGARLFATIVCKATFAFPEDTADGMTTLVDPSAILRAEQHHHGNPGRSIRQAVDAVPLKGRADVVLVGNAHVVGEPASECRPRLCVTRGGSVILDKTLRVVGNRATVESRPSPFSALPLVYERSDGGIGIEYNPFGSEIPNILPTRPAQKPAGFAPISQIWPVRKRLLRGQSIQGTHDIADVEIGLEHYFQCAPLDQQTDKWTGGEHILLEALDPRHPSRTLQLPQVRAVALLRSAKRAEVELPLACDTIFVEADRSRCSLTWRAAHAFEDRASLRATVFHAGLEIAGRSVVWPDPVLDSSPTTVRIDAPDSPLDAKATPALGGTLVMEDAPPAPRPSSPSLSSTLVSNEPEPTVTLPFRGAAQHSGSAAPASIAGAPWARTKVEDVDIPRSSRTIELQLEETEVPEAEEPPIVEPPPAAVAARPRVVPTAWRRPDAEPAPQPPPPPAARNAAQAQAQSRAERPNIRKRIYGKFGDG